MSKKEIKNVVMVVRMVEGAMPNVLASFDPEGNKSPLRQAKNWLAENLEEPVVAEALQDGTLYFFSGHPEQVSLKTKTVLSFD